MKRIEVGACLKWTGAKNYRGATMFTRNEASFLEMDKVYKVVDTYKDSFNVCKLEGSDLWFDIAWFNLSIDGKNEKLFILDKYKEWLEVQLKIAETMSEEVISLSTILELKKELVNTELSIIELKTV